MLSSLLLLIVLIAQSHIISASPLLQQPFFNSKDSDEDIKFQRNGWYDPRYYHGSLINVRRLLLPLSLLLALHTHPFLPTRFTASQKVTDTLGEPLNIIISNLSSPDVLTEHGFVSFSRSLGLWNECANIHLGDPQFANLGDGNGWMEELYEMRENRGLPWVGSCLESVVGE